MPPRWANAHGDHAFQPWVGSAGHIASRALGRPLPHHQVIF